MSGSVRRTTDGWVADVTIDGVRRTRRAKTRNEALAKKKELLEHLASRPAANRSTGTGITIRDARELSLRIRWKGTSWERTAGIYSRHAVEFFGASVQLGAIGAPEIERWRQHLLAQGNQPSTVNRKVSCLRSMLNDAALHGHIQALPPIPRQMRVTNTKDRVISKQELEQFCAFFREINEPEFADLLVFLTLTCARWGEAERLRGEDVDLEKGLITFWKTKNGHPRTIAVGPKACSVLEAYVPAVPRQRIWGYPYWRAKNLFNRAKGALGLADDEQLTIHCTRHTGATRMAQAGVPLQQIAAYGGWRSLAAVQRYMHLQTHQLTACVAAIEGQ